jgi:UDP-N-acetyl-D-mannosaminuronic acid dehydrogenase
MTALTAKFGRENTPANTAARKIAVFGLGYVGLPVSAVFAGCGFDVVGVDVEPHIVETINKGRVHIVEPDLDMVVRAAVSAGKLRATLKPEPADAFIIAVPTPFTGDKQPDLRFVRQATDAIAPVLRKGNLVVLESTSPVGTTDEICARIAALRPDLTLPDPSRGGGDIHIAHCPERVLPGRVLHELVHNDRIIGGISPECAKQVAELYRSFMRGELHLTDARAAELAKLTENAYRDVNIAFANELSIICEKLGIDVWNVIELANRHPRVNILKPGPGVGGHCIAVDPWFIVAAAGDSARLLRTAREVNDSKPKLVFEKVKNAAKKLGSPMIACLGLSYKADIDDLRESPSLEIVEMLAHADIGPLQIVEPHIQRLPASLSGHRNLRLSELEPALAACQIVVLLVDHRAFRSLDRKLLEGKVVIDTRGIWR